MKCEPFRAHLIEILRNEDKVDGTEAELCHTEKHLDNELHGTRHAAQRPRPIFEALLDRLRIIVKGGAWRLGNGQQGAAYEQPFAMDAHDRNHRQHQSGAD